MYTQEICIRATMVNDVFLVHREKTELFFILINLSNIYALIYRKQSKSLCFPYLPFIRYTRRGLYWNNSDQFYFLMNMAVYIFISGMICFQIMLLSSLLHFHKLQELETGTGAAVRRTMHLRGVFVSSQIKCTPHDHRSDIRGAAVPFKFSKSVTFKSIAPRTQ